MSDLNLYEAAELLQAAIDSLQVALDAVKAEQGRIERLQRYALANTLALAEEQRGHSGHARRQERDEAVNRRVATWDDLVEHADLSPLGAYWHYEDGEDD